MTTSKWIAGLMGPTFVAMAAALLINLNSMPELTEEISHEPMLILVSGTLLFIAGLAILRVHNRWGCRLVDRGYGSWLACHTCRPCENALPCRIGHRHSWDRPEKRRDRARAGRLSVVRYLPHLQSLWPRLRYSKHRSVWSEPAFFALRRLETSDDRDCAGGPDDFREV